MKKITRKRFTQSKGNKSFFGSVARFGAAIPLCLLMLGGLSFTGFESAQAAAGGPGGNAAGANAGTPGTPDPGLWNLATDSTTITVGSGGSGNTGTNGLWDGGKGGNTDVSGVPPLNTDNIIFTGAVGGLGGTATAAGTGGTGGNAGTFNWTSSTAVTVGSITNTAAKAGDGGAGSAVTGTTAGTGGNSSALNILFGSNNLTLTSSTGGNAIDLTAGIGGDGGATGGVANLSGGTGGTGGDITLTAGLISSTRTDGTAASISFTGGLGGAGGAATALATLSGQAGGTGGAGGKVDLTIGGINMTSPIASGSTLSFTGGAGGASLLGNTGNTAGASSTALFVGQAGGAGGAGGSVTAKVSNNITASSDMFLTGGAATVGNTGGAATANNNSIGGMGGAGGSGGDVVLTMTNQGSITVAGGLTVAGTAGQAGGNGGDANTGNFIFAGAGGKGGSGGGVSLLNAGNISVAGALTINSGAGASGGVAGANGSANGAAGNGGDGGSGGNVKIGAVNLKAGATTIDANGADGISALAGATNNNGTAGNAGTTGNVTIEVTDKISVDSLTITANGGIGGASGTNGAVGANGSAGGTVSITAKELNVTGALALRNFAGANGSNANGATVGVGGAAGSIDLSKVNMILASQVSGISGQTYNMGGFGLDAAHNSVSFTGDLSGTTGNTASAPGTAFYNIGTLRVDATGGNPIVSDTIYRSLTADNLSHLSVANFDFIMPSEVKNGDILLQVNNVTPTTTADDLLIDGTKGISIQTPARLKNLHRNLGTVTLIDGEVTGVNTVVGRRINSGIYRFVLEEGSLDARLDGIPGFNAYAEAQAARLAFVADAQNFIITSGIYEMSRAVESSDELGVKFFASGYGSKNRYRTGHQSFADIQGGGFLAGAGWGVDTVDGQRLLLGAFMEGGWGSYDTRSSSHGVSYDAKGNTDYIGGGILAKYTFPFGLYFDLSGRVGNSKIDFRSYDTGFNGYENSFDSSNSTYFGGHIGGGWLWAIDEEQALDFNTRLLWTHLNSDNVRSNFGDEVDFNSADSVRWRTGVRYNYAFDLGSGGTIKPFVGAAYEHEFNGDANVHVDGRRTERKPSLQGGTAIGELGASWQATDNFSVEIAGQGNLFTRQGGGGNLSLKWEF